MNVRPLMAGGPLRAVASPNGSPFGAPLIDPCNIVPEPCTLRPLDWARDIQRGNKVELCQPGEEKTVVSLDNGHVQCAETIDIVLTSEICENEPILDPTSLAWPHVVAHICWGIGSQTFDAWIDVQTGTHFSIVAEMLRVNASYQLVVPPWEKEPAICPTFRVKGGLGYGCSKRIQLTQIAFAEKPGDACVLAVPPFAEAIVVMVANGGKASVRILPFGGALGVPVFAGSGVSDLLPLMGGAQSVEVTNTGDGPLAAFLVFVLGL